MPTKRTRVGDSNDSGLAPSAVVHDALEKTINKNSQQLNLFLIIPILLRMKCSINHSLYAGLIEAPSGAITTLRNLAIPAAPIAARTATKAQLKNVVGKSPLKCLQKQGYCKYRNQ